MKTLDKISPSRVNTEFERSRMPDARLAKRLRAIGQQFAANPQASIPQAGANRADLEGTYRFLNNDRVSFGDIVGGHFEATAQRSGAYESVLVIHDTTEAKSGYPDTLAVNIVVVTEIDSPQGVEPVSWRLVTTEPIDTPEAVLRVVDVYRARWLIEEYFKALKTGCRYESLQLESYDALLRALAIYLPVAWLLLRMRYLAGARTILPRPTY